MPELVAAVEVYSAFHFTSFFVVCVVCLLFVFMLLFFSRASNLPYTRTHTNRFFDLVMA